MRYAPVAPIDMLTQLQEHDALGNYNLFETPDVVTNLSQYRDLVKKMDKGVIILDTGIMQGEQAQIGDTYVAIEAVKPSHVILPDVLGDAHMTFLSAVGGAHVLDRVRKRQHFEYMYVLQGTTIDEAIRAWEQTLDIYPDITAVGIPYKMGDQYGTRIPLIRRVRERNRGIKMIHLLGLDYNYLSDSWFCNQYFMGSKTMFGIDSSLPVMAAQKGENILHWEEAEVRKDKFARLRATRNDNWWLGGKWDVTIAQKVLQLREWLEYNDHSMGMSAK